MTKLVVRCLEDDIKVALQRRADRHGRSLEDEVRNILRNAVKPENSRASTLGSRITARFKKSGLATELPELRKGRARSAGVKF